jgi:hypothetical protein
LVLPFASDGASGKTFRSHDEQEPSSTAVTRWAFFIYHKINKMNYQDFLKTKQHLIGQFGFDPIWMPDIAFDFQQFIIEKALKKGRMAIFADTGLGKTLIQLSIAENIIRKTNKKVLILTPLAVAFQFVEEANKIGVSDIEYSKDGKYSKNIVVCNYERLHYFDPADFVGIILDESSVLKNFNGKVKDKVTVFSKKIKYRFLSTATPSPNDFIELGTSSEVLGYMGYMDMLGRFFKNNQGSSDSRNRNIGEKFYLKPHAEKDFFAWVNQWAMMVKMPSDIGFSDEKYILPELLINNIVVKNQSLIDLNGQIQMFTPIAKTRSEILHEQRQTVEERCQKAVECAHGKTSVYWCNLNDEGNMIAEMDTSAVQISGKMSIDQKEETLIAFSSGQIDRLITKAKMTSFGLNWQHCNHTVYFPTFSYEQYYQAIRRFWRFGQKKPVIVDRVISDGQKRVITAIDQKTQKAIDLYEKLTNNVNHYEEKQNSYSAKMDLPLFLNH